MVRDAVVFYRSFLEAIEELDEKDQLAAYRNIVNYGINGIEPNEKGPARAVFLMAKPQIDSNNKKYENGLKPKKQVTSKPEASHKQDGSRQEAKEKDKDKDKEKDLKDSSPEPKISSGPTAGKFILNDGTEYTIPENDVDYYQKLYPGVDVRGEIRKIEAWCYSNPTRRKTRNGAKRFLNAWLAKEQNRTNGSTQNRTTVPNRFHNFPQRDTDYNAIADKMTDEWLSNFGGDKR